MTSRVEQMISRASQLLCPSRDDELCRTASCILRKTSDFVSGSHLLIRLRSQASFKTGIKIVSFTHWTVRSSIYYCYGIAKKARWCRHIPFRCSSMTDTTTRLANSDLTSASASALKSLIRCMREATHVLARHAGGGVTALSDAIPAAHASADSIHSRSQRSEVNCTRSRSPLSDAAGHISSQRARIEELIAQSFGWGPVNQMTVEQEIRVQDAAVEAILDWERAKVRSPDLVASTPLQAGLQRYFHLYATYHDELQADLPRT